MKTRLLILSRLKAKKSILFFFSLCLCSQLFSQELRHFNTVVDTDLGWPWNWDMEVDNDTIYFANEKGIIYIFDGENWDKLIIDPGNNFSEIRGIDKADDGTIWATTTDNGLFSYDGQTITNYNMSNSSVPSNELRDVICVGDVVWVSTDEGEGIFSFQDGNVSRFTKSNSDLDSDFTNDFFHDELGNLYISSSNFLHIVSPSGVWENYNIRDVIFCNTFRMHIVSSTEIWVATDNGVAFFDGSMFTSYQAEYGDRNYGNIYKASNGDLWLGEVFEGIAIVRNEQIQYFSNDDYPGIPSQVFKFEEYKDSIRMVGNIGNAFTTATYDIRDATYDLAGSTLSIYPNPTSNWVQVDVSGPLNHLMTVYDMYGKQVSQVRNSNQVDVNHLPSGTYFLEVLDLTKQQKVVERIAVIK